MAEISEAEVVRDPSEDPVLPETGDDIPQLADVHVHGLLEDDLGGIDVVGVVPHELVVDYGGQQVVSRCDRVDVAGEMEVDIPHGVHLGVSSAGGSALDTEGGSDGRLPEGSDDLLPELSEALDQTDGGDGLPFACGGGGYR